MKLDGIDENGRKGDCITRKRRDFKAIKQFETLGFFFVTAIFFFLTDVQGNIYLQNKKYPVHIGEEYELNYICVHLQEITEVMDPLVLI